mgnify:CR=1 FL=1
MLASQRLIAPCDRHGKTPMSPGEDFGGYQNCSSGLVVSCPSPLPVAVCCCPLMPADCCCLFQRVADWCCASLCVAVVEVGIAAAVAFVERNSNCSSPDYSLLLVVAFDAFQELISMQLGWQDSLVDIAEIVAMELWRRGSHGQE